MKINSSLIIQNVTLRDLDNYSCVAINRGGMAECKTNLALVQVSSEAGQSWEMIELYR